MSIGLCLEHYFGDHEDLYICSYLFNNAKTTSFDCVNSNIYSCILSLLKYIDILIYELDVLYILYINIVCPHKICEFI